MNRSFLKWFYIGVQFVMLAVSIPKVATLFHAYDLHTVGPLVGGIDLRSWLVGIAVDLTATITTWAAMAKYEANRKHIDLIPPAVIILVCTSLSVIANYEDAATLHPAQYAGINLFTQPALLVNPVLISAPPILVFLLIILVPSVLAQPRIKTAAEIEAETTQEVALIEANARLKETRARANAKVLSARVSGLADTVGVVAKRTGLASGAQPNVQTTAALLAPNTSGDPMSESGLLALPGAHVSRAMWNTMSIKDRVLKSGVISTNEVGEVLGVSATRARELVKEVRTTSNDQPAVPGRTGVPYQSLVDALYERRTNDSFVQAQKLEKALGLRKRGGRPQPTQLHVVSSDEVAEEGEEAAQ